MYVVFAIQHPATRCSLCSSLQDPIPAPPHPNPASHPHLQFAHILFSLWLYILLPYVRRYLLIYAPAAYHSTTITLHALALALLCPLAWKADVAYALLVAGVQLAAPLAMARMHKFKAQITGPWDEAVPKVPMWIEAGGKREGSMAGSMGGCMNR